MLFPIASAPARLSDRQERCRDDPGLFGIPPPPPGPALSPGMPDHAHRRDRAPQTWQRTPCPASRGHREAPFAGSRSRPKVHCHGVRKARAVWEDTRIATGYPPGIVLPGPRRVFAILNCRRRAPAQTPRHTPHRGPFPVPCRPGVLLRPIPVSAMCFANGLRGLVNGSPLAIAALLRALDRVPPPDSGVSHLSGTRQDQSLVVGRPVLRLQVSARPIDLAFHPCFVALEIGEVLAVDQKMTVFQFKV